MKHIITALIAAAVIAPSAPARDTAAIKHKFLALDFWKAKIHYVDENNPAANWSEPWGGGLKDMQLIGNKQLLVSNSQGWTIYDLETRKKVADVRLDGINGISTARRLPDGRTFLGINQKTDGKESVAVCELDAKNTLVRKTVLPGLRWLRLMRRTPQDTWLLSEWKGTVEVTLKDGIADDKRILNNFILPRPRNAFMALRKPDGNTLVAGGYSAGLFEYKPNGELLREFVATQPQGMTNHFYAALQLLKNGHIIQSNWNGHSDKDYKPGWKLIEFNPDGKIVWTWNEPPEKIGTLNGLIILDDIDIGVLNDDVNGILGPIN